MKKILLTFSIILLSYVNYAQDKPTVTQATTTLLKGKTTKQLTTVRIDIDADDKHDIEIKSDLDGIINHVFNPPLTNGLKIFIWTIDNNYKPSDKTEAIISPNPPKIANYDDFENDLLQIVKVEQKDNQYKVTYFNRNKELCIHHLEYKYGKFYTNNTFTWGSLSIMIVPIKVRPAIQQLKQFAKADVKNIGVNFGVANWNYKKYMQDGIIKEYRLAIGGIVAPAVETFNAGNTNNYYTSGNEKSQLVLSTGITFAGAYKGVSFAIIPAGVDFGLTSESKHWVYRGKYWYGFGLALDTKLFGF